MNIDELLNGLPDGIRGNALIYRLTIQVVGIEWRAGYYCNYDNIWRIHVDAETPSVAIIELRKKVLVSVIHSPQSADDH